MKKKKVVPAALIAMMLLGIATASAAGIDTTKMNSINAKSMNLMKEDIPLTYETAEKLTEDATPVPHRFLMWTHDGRHIMWGRYAGGYFVGTDNLGKKAWGIYHNGAFAGFYDEELFTGRYRNGFWRAENLFNERITYGRYVLFPPVIELSAEEIGK